MAREIPEPVRAAAGLAATLLEEARKLPSTLPALPVRALGLAMQTALKLQQEYSGLVARGDEVLTGLRGDSGQGLATFDEDLPTPPPPRPASSGLGSRDSAFDRVVEDPTDDYDEGSSVDQAADLAADLADDLADERADELADAVAAPATEDAQTPLTVVDAAAAVGDDDLSDETLAEEERLAEALAADLGDADLTDDEVATLPADPEADEVTATVDELAVNMSDDAAEDDAVIAASEAALSAGHDAGPTTAPSDDTAADTPTDTTPSDTTPTEPVDGYDGFSIAQLRGRLRGYQPVTVEELLTYEQATRDRAPFVTLLRNRKEKLDRERG